MIQVQNQDVDHTVFVGRASLLHDLYAKWQAFTEGSHTYLGFFLYAIAGMGKTWTLRTFYYRVLAKQQPALWLRILDREEVVPTLPAPPDLIDSGDARQDLIQLPIMQRRPLREGLAEVAVYLGEPNPWAHLLSDLDVRYDLEFALPPPQPENRPIALCFDGVDLLERFELQTPSAAVPMSTVSLWENLQQKWLLPILQRKHCFILLTGQGEPIWSEWIIGDMLKSMRLMPLTEAETRELLQVYDQEYNTKDVHHLSQGYPEAIVSLVKKHALAESLLLDKPSTLVHETSEENRRRLDDIQNEQPDVYQFLLATAPMRQLKLSIINKLPHINCSPSRFGRYVASLRELGIVQAVHAQLSIEPAVRHMLIEQRRITDRSKLAQEYKTLIDVYYQLIVANPLLEEGIFIEWLYVSLEYQRISTPSSESTTWLVEFYNLWKDMPQNIVLSKIQHDQDILWLLHELHYSQILSNLKQLLNDPDRWKKIKEELDLLIRRRMPGDVLVKDDKLWLLLRKLSKLDGFRLRDVQRIVSEIDNGQPESLMGAQKKTRMLSELYVIRRFGGVYHVDEWLSAYLKATDIHQ